METILVVKRVSNFENSKLTLNMKNHDLLVYATPASSPFECEMFEASYEIAELVLKQHSQLETFVTEETENTDFYIAAHTASASEILEIMKKLQLAFEVLRSYLHKHHYEIDLKSASDGKWSSFKNFSRFITRLVFAEKSEPEILALIEKTSETTAQELSTGISST